MKTSFLWSLLWSWSWISPKESTLPSVDKLSRHSNWAVVVLVDHCIGVEHLQIWWTWWLIWRWNTKTWWNTEAFQGWKAFSDNFFLTTLLILWIESQIFKEHFRMNQKFKWWGLVAITDGKPTYRHLWCSLRPCLVYCKQLKAVWGSCLPQHMLLAPPEAVCSESEKAFF